MLSIFSSKHVKNSIRAANTIASENSDLLASKYVADKANSILKADKKKTEASINEDGLSYRGLALLVMSNVIFNELSSGTHHIYRGTLNMTGQSMNQLWPRICNGLIAENLSNADDVKAETIDLEAAISSAG